MSPFNVPKITKVNDAHEFELRDSALDVLNRFNVTLGALAAQDDAFEPGKPVGMQVEETDGVVRVVVTYGDVRLAIDHHNVIDAYDNTPYAEDVITSLKKHLPPRRCPRCNDRYINKPDYLCHECRYGV
jgi:hypothetical protein